MPPREPSFRKSWSTKLWVTSAALFVVSCYLFSWMLSVGCLYLAVAGFGEDKFDLYAWAVRLTFGVLGATIAWSLFPRRRSLPPPGVLLDLSAHPRLAREIELVASAFNEPIPLEVFLDPGTLVGVGQHGGRAHFGGRRYLIVGLLLMQIVQIPQFRAILAHEFAHYYGGDTSWGPWLYATRAAMARTVTNLFEKNEFTKIVQRLPIIHLPYLGLLTIIRLQWELFLQVTSLVSRQQEYRCDELAARLAGPSSFISALLTAASARGLDAHYWESAVSCALQVGCMPPIAEGFSSFRDDRLQRQISGEVRDEPNRTKPTRYDSHPPLGSRIARVKNLNVNDDGGSQPSGLAVTMLDNIPHLESALVQHMFPGIDLSEVASLPWNSIGTYALVPLWRKHLEFNDWFFCKFTVRDLPEAIQLLPSLVATFRDEPGTLLHPAQRLGIALDLLTHAFILALIDDGWQFHTHPENAYLFNSSHKLYPFSLLHGIAKGRTDAKAWPKLAESYEIDKLPLVSIAAKQSGQAAPG